jgi:hypothetical protein
MRHIVECRLLVSKRLLGGFQFTFELRDAFYSFSVSLLNRRTLHRLATLQ